MTEKEKSRLLARAEKLKPKPVLRPSGKWGCQIMVRGNRVYVDGDTPEEANANAIAEKAKLAERYEEREEERKGHISLRDAITLYINRRENVLSPSTINGYKEVQRNRFPELMKMRVCDIDKKDIQQAINDDAKKISAKTIKNALGLVLSTISEYKEIDSKRLRLPQEKRKEHAFLDEKGMVELFDAIRGSSVELPILLAVWLGMRRSEIMGLCWDCVDFEKKQIHIRRTYIRDKEKGYVLTDNTKTVASRRTLDCPDYILTKLEAYTPNSRKGQVFKMHPNTIYKLMRDICDRNGIDFVGVHGLRHTNASIMLSLGIVDKVAMARGGWSTDVTMKSVYQHVFADDKKAAGILVDSYFERVAEGKFATEIATENEKS